MMRETIAQYGPSFANEARDYWHSVKTGDVGGILGGNFFKSGGGSSKKGVQVLEKVSSHSGRVLPQSPEMAS